MFKSYLKTAIRNIRRQKTTAFINIGGLALGVCAFLLLMEYISLEGSVNKFHSNLDKTYRLINVDPAGETWPEVEPGWAKIFQQRFAAVQQACRFNQEGGITVVQPENSGGESFSEQYTGYADGNFFKFFSFPVLKGNAAALNNAYTVFISASQATKYFGDSDPINQTLVINNQFGNVKYRVGGVFEDMGDNSDIHYDLLLSYATLDIPANLNGNDWAKTDNLSSQYINTFFYISPGTNIPELEQQLTSLRTSLKSDKDGIQFRLQPLSEIHLGKSLDDPYPTIASLKYIYMLGIIALLILLIAWFNYINLSTANAFRRANEVGVRKVIGASRKQLAFQFLAESLVVNIVAIVLAIFIVALIQPAFNKLIGKDLSLLVIINTRFWIYGIAFLFVGAILSGAYSAFVLSGFNPIQTLKGKISKTSRGLLLRKSLVVAQFSISIMLIIATVLIYSQLHYMQNKSLGLNTEQLLIVRGPQAGKDSLFNQKKSAFKNALAGESFVQNYSASGTVPSGNFNFSTSGFTQPASKPGDELKGYAFAIIDDRYLSTFNIDLLAGRNFTPAETAVSWNENNKVLLNETAVKQLGFTDYQEAITTPIRWDERYLNIIGVIKDYSHSGAARAVEPIMFYPQENSSYFTIKLTPQNISSKISSVEKIFKTNFPGNPFEYSFLDENFNKLYASEKQYSQIFTAAAGWAIAIACLGLFGLVSFTVESRTKEIGVRKVLGADISSIVGLLSKDFVLLVLIAFVIAAPVAAYFLNKWLADFANHINMSWWIFALAGISALTLALATISFQAIKAAIANPVTSLRSE